MKKIIMLLIALSALCAASFAGCEVEKPNAYNNDSKSADIVHEEQIDAEDNNGSDQNEPAPHEPRRRPDDCKDGCPHCKHRIPHFKDGRKNPPMPMPSPENP